MSKAAVVGVVVIVGIGVVGGGGYYYLNNKANLEFQNGVHAFENLTGTTIKYESYKVSILSQTATLNKVVAKDTNGNEYTADSATLGKFTSDNKNNFKLASIALDKIHSTIKGGTVDIAHVDAKDVSAPEGAIVTEDGKLKKIYLSKFNLSSLNLQNVKLTGPDKTVMTIGQYSLNNYGIDKNSDQTLKEFNLSVTPDGQQGVKLNLVEIDGANIARIIEMVEQGKTPRALPGQPSKAVVEGLTSNVSNQDWKLDKFSTDNNSVAANGDMKTSATFSGLTINAAHNPKLYPIKQLGYDLLEISGDISGTYDAAKEVWSIAPLNLTINNMGNMSTTMKFNAPPNLADFGPQELMSAYKIIAFKMTLKDQGLLQKIYELQAKKQNKINGMISSVNPSGDKAATVTPEQAKTDLVNKIKQDAQSATIPVQKQGDEALLQLINDPKQSLVIEMNPTAPVAAMELMGKSQVDILDALKLSVKAETVK